MGFVYIGAALFLLIQIQILLCLKKFFWISLIAPLAFTVYLLLYRLTPFKELCIYHTLVLKRYSYCDIAYAFFLFTIYPFGRLICYCLKKLKQ